MTELSEKEKHKIRLERMKSDKEERLKKREERRRKTTPYFRESPRDLVDSYYLGRLTDEDS